MWQITKNIFTVGLSVLTPSDMKDTYDEVKNHFRENSKVTIAENRGAQRLKHNDKMFVMFYKEDLTVKLT